MFSPPPSPNTHPPQIAGESEVKAQVKLRFKTSTGMPVVVARSYQVWRGQATRGRWGWGWG